MLILSAKDRLENKLKEFNKGADDYLCKPFSFDEINRMFDDIFSGGWMRPFRFGHPSWGHLPTPFEVDSGFTFSLNTLRDY